MTFEEALQALEIGADVGPTEAKRAFYLQLQKHGPEPSPEMYQKFSSAYEFLKDPSVWPNYKAPQAKPQPNDPVADDEDTNERRSPPGHRKSTRARPQPSQRAQPSGGGSAGGPIPGVGAPIPGVKTIPGAPAADGPQSPASNNPQASAAYEQNVIAQKKALSENPDIRDALERLEKSYKSVVTADEILGVLATGDPETITTLIRGLVDKGSSLACSAVVSMVLELMAADHKRNWLTVRDVVKLGLKLHEKAVDRSNYAAAMGLQRVLDRWCLSIGMDKLGLDVMSTSQLRWLNELSKLPETFPSNVRVLLAMAASRGDMRHCRQDLETWAGSNKEEALAMRVEMAKIAPHLLKTIADILPLPVEKGRKIAILERLHIPPWVVPVSGFVILMGIALSFFLDEGTYPKHLAAELEQARSVICEYVGKGRESCWQAFKVEKMIQSKDCDGIKMELPKIRKKIAGGANIRGAMSQKDENFLFAMAQVTVIEQAAAVRCSF